MKPANMETWAWVCMGLGFVFAVGILLVGPDEPLGDTIGGVAGTMFALAGVLLFYAALLYQRKELSLQRDELRLQRTELKATTEALRSQRTEMERGRKAEATLNLAFRLEGSRTRRLAAVATLRRYSEETDRRPLNRGWGLDPRDETHPPDAISRALVASGIPATVIVGEGIEEMLSLLAVCRFAWVEDLVDRSDLAGILKPEVLDLRDIYDFACRQGSFTLDRYTRGYEWLVDVASEANVTSASI